MPCSGGLGTSIGCPMNRIGFGNRAKRLKRGLGRSTSATLTPGEALPRARFRGTPTWSCSRPCSGRGTDPDDCDPRAHPRSQPGPRAPTPTVDITDRPAPHRRYEGDADGRKTVTQSRRQIMKENSACPRPRTPHHGHRGCGRPVSVRRMRPATRRCAALRILDRHPAAAVLPLVSQGAYTRRIRGTLPPRDLPPRCRHWPPPSSWSSVSPSSVKGTGTAETATATGTAWRDPSMTLRSRPCPRRSPRRRTSRHDAVIHRHYITGRRGMRGAWRRESITGVS